MAKLGLFSGNIVLLGCILVIIDFDISGILCVFTVSVRRMEKPGLLICTNKICGKHCWKSDILTRSGIFT